MMKLSVAIATFNEEKNIGKCLESVKGLADEIIIVDGGSEDKTVEIANNYHAKITITDNPPIFHINKQKALDLCTGEWILQLDADEIVTAQLKDEIAKILEMSQQELEEYEKHLPNLQLFIRHQQIVAKRDGQIGQDYGEFVAFFIPRLNYFLGKYLKYGGVYPDGVIRLIKRGKALFPAKSVHEQISIDGRVGWLNNDLIHMADPTFKRYLQRNSRYIDLITTELKEMNLPKNPRSSFLYFVIKPIHWFLLTQIRHKGILDGYQGIVFSFFSALRFPRAYWRYLKNV